MINNSQISMKLKFNKLISYLTLLIAFGMSQTSEAVTNYFSINNENYKDELIVKKSGGGKKNGGKKNGGKKSGGKKNGGKKNGGKKNGGKKNGGKKNGEKDIKANKKDQENKKTNIEIIESNKISLKERARERYRKWKENNKIKKSEK